MPLHLVKLCVGVNSVADLVASVERRTRQARVRGTTCGYTHVTRMMPKRRHEILAPQEISPESPQRIPQGTPQKTALPQQDLPQVIPQPHGGVQCAVRRGSLFWVIRGVIACRQEIEELRAEKDREGRSCCAIVLRPLVVCTRAQARRAFQGWRYLEERDAPADIPARPGTGPDTAFGTGTVAHDLLEEDLIRLGIL